MSSENTDREYKSDIENLYGTLLRRSPDADGLKNSILFLENGGSLDHLSDAIKESDEFLNRKKLHPLEDYNRFYRPDLISYFTHRGTYRPLALTIETINICNNDCIICPYSSQSRKRGTMEQELFEKIVASYVEIGGGPLSLTPMVGEVFLDKKLRERLRHLRKFPSITDVSAITNATMVHRYDDDELSDIVGLFDRLTVSIYGLDDEEFFIMTRKREYDEFRQGLVRLLKICGPSRLTLSARLLRERSQADIDQWILGVANDAGVDAASLIFGATSTFSNWSFFDTTKNLPFNAKWKRSAENVKQCGLPLISMQIYSDGRVSFCGCADFNADQELMLGDIRTQSLKEILSQPQVERLWDWQSHGIPSFCRNCSFHLPLDDVPASAAVFSNPYKEFGG